ncbi:conserved hypothetical protein [Gloeothece citriformis PCC 7424]|uniref:Cytoskeleton protein RodZ-like C-terminal domain-containing protein n=1 Tax=Gloeothece citriformis (strain PCC 7424) TaxID=65393 RepID=B7K6Y5_GLOC7|nr:RodZ domain-containing protein [Gloeothece citriformis]ACK72684.1 conserved hypothetical protein [Gloeothece citriformis PCC 7424]
MFRKKPKINPHEEQQAKLIEIGAKLQQIRTEQGLSLETITKQTRIPVRLLKAIEAADMDSLPEPVYIRGLIKQFADFLGLEGSPLARTFPVYLTTKSYRSSFYWRLPGLQLRPIHLYFLYILLVIFSVRGISHILKQSVLEMNSLNTQSQTQVQSTTPNPADSQASTKPVVVNLKLKEKCWLRVVVDGKTQFEGVLPEGTHRTWIANKQLTVRAGNAGGVLITFNDNKSKQLGKPGQMQEITFNARSPVDNENNRN